MSVLASKGIVTFYIVCPPSPETEALTQPGYFSARKVSKSIYTPEYLIESIPSHAITSYLLYEWREAKRFVIQHTC